MADDRVFIGLRGPVLRGWAVMIDLEAGNGPSIESAADRSRGMPLSQALP